MPSGAKKRKAAKKKQEEQASSTQINLNSNNHESRSQEERESSDDGVSKKAGFTEVLDTDERVEITDSSHDHDKSSSGSSSSSSSSDDESREVQKKDDIEENVSEVITVTSVPDQPVPLAGEAPFMGCTANVIVENTGLMDSATPSDPNSKKTIEILPVDTMIANEAEQISLPKPNEITAEASLATVSDVKENEGKTSPLPESNVVTEDCRESEVVISHEEEAPVRSTHGVAQRTSWLSCCGLFDVATGSSR